MTSDIWKRRSFSLKSGKAVNPHIHTLYFSNLWIFNYIKTSFKKSMLNYQQTTKQNKKSNKTNDLKQIVNFIISSITQISICFQHHNKRPPLKLFKRFLSKDSKIQLLFFFLYFNGICNSDADRKFLRFFLKHPKTRFIKLKTHLSWSKATAAAAAATFD